MLAPSLKRAPLALVALALSEPARSIRLIFAMQTLGFRLAVLSCCLKYIWTKGYKSENKKKTFKYIYIFQFFTKNVRYYNLPTSTLEEFYFFFLFAHNLLCDFTTELKYLKYSMRPGRGGIHISRVLCPVAIARIQSFKNMFC